MNVADKVQWFMTRDVADDVQCCRAMNVADKV